MGFYETNRDNIESLIRRGVFDSKQIALWQVDGYARDSISIFVKHGIKPEVILSFDREIIGKKVWGISVVEPFIWLRKNKSSVVLLMSKEEYAIHKKVIVKDIGFDPRQIYINLNKPAERTGLGSAVRKSERLLKRFSEKIKFGIKAVYSRSHTLIMILRGLSIYKKTREKVGEETSILYINYQGIGDALLLLLLLFGAYKKKEGLIDYAFLTCSGASDTVIRLFEPDAKIVRITVDEHDCIIRLADLVGYKALGMKKMVKLPLYKDVYMKLAGKKYTLFDTFSKYVYGLNDNEIKITKLAKSAEYTYAKELFEQYKLIPGKTVIMAPNANSEPPLSLDIWGGVAASLIQKGYRVLTMCHGEESPVKFTDPIDFPLNKAIEVVDYAGYFIGVRCGFTDLISGSECRKIVLYPESPDIDENNRLLKHMNNATIYEHTAFSRMGIGKNILDLKVDYRYNNRLEKSILEYFGEY